MSGGRASDGRFGAGNRAARKPRSIAELAQVIAREVEAAKTVSVVDEDLVRYRDDPVLYALERLGVELMPQQQAIAFAAAGQWDRITPEMRELADLRGDGHRMIAVRAAVKTGKSTGLVCLAFWFFECRRHPEHGAKFLLTAAKGDQIRTVIWAEMRRIINPARCPHPPKGKLQKDPAKGFVSPDELCSIVGFTGRDAESMAGQSGNQMIAIDEASSLIKEKWDAIFGNLSGDRKGVVLLFGNPIRSDGPFYDAFHSRKGDYVTAHFDGVPISAWNERQAKPRDFIIHSAAIEESRMTRGETDEFHVSRMRGNFIEGEAGKIVPMVVLAAAQERWHELRVDADGLPLKGRELELEWERLCRSTARGTLRIGCDPASEQLRRDQWGFAVVRGDVCLEVFRRRGLSIDQGLAELWVLLERYRAPAETPELAVDVDGDVGNKVRLRVAEEAERRKQHDVGRAFEFCAIRSGSKNVRDRARYVLVRDEMHKVMSDWIKTGAIPPDGFLETELYAPNWEPQPDGRTRVTSKEGHQGIRARIHRSPDLADALMNALYIPAGAAAAADDAASAQAAPPDEGDPFTWANREGERAPVPAAVDPADPFGWT